MTFVATPPQSWARFCGLIQSNAPEFPLQPQSAIVDRTDRANRAVGLLSTILTAAGVNVPSVVGHASTIAGIRGPADLAHAAVDEAASRGVTALMGPEAATVPGMIVGNGIAVLRGAVQAIGRSDEMEEYLQQIIAYVQTLARTALRAQRDDRPYAQLPDPMIPQDMLRNASVHNSRHRQGYQHGFRRVNTVIREIDSQRPVGSDGTLAWYSKQNFLHLYMMGNRNLTLPQDPSHSWRVRNRIEAYVVAEILARNLLREREQLRRWAMTG